MSLVTTCPACSTAFRVTPEQLSAHRGDVRCGQCQHIFNALQKLEEVEFPVNASSPASIEPPSAVDVPEFDKTLILEIPEPVIGDDAVGEASDVGGAVDFELDFPAVAVVENLPDPEVVADVAETLAETATASPEPAALAPEVSAPPAAVAQAEPEPHSAPASLQPKSTRGVPRWLLVLLALLLLGSALGQTVYFMRTEIAASYPPLRPWLEQACRHLACVVALPRQADLLSIEDSDLLDDPDHAGVLLLASALYNRAPYPQAYPLLELTLTDTYDKPVLRRTFTPQEYLPSGTDIQIGLAAGAEVRARLPLMVEGEKPAGYRLYVRY